MAPASADPSFKEIRIGTFFEQGVIVIRLQKGGVTLPEMKYELFTGFANICKHTNFGLPAGNNKTVGI
ncbi:hypothetical protein D3C86_2097750 [compost metagenome]